MAHYLPGFSVEVQRLFEVTQGTLVRQTITSGAAKPKRTSTRRLGKMAQVSS